ncbi:MAG: cysteine hydrolase family protein [Streptosporangiaceae bacterium]
MSSTALILVDVIVSFFDPVGPNYYPDAPRVLDPIATLLAAARAHDTLVVHAVERHYPGLLDFEHAKLPHHCEIGAEDAEYFLGFEPVSRIREIEVPKRRYSAFYATDLDLVLREQGVDRVVVTGVKTNVCVRATVQDAFAGGFEVLLPREATNSNRPQLAAASLEDIDRYFGRVVELPEALDALIAG